MITVFSDNIICRIICKQEALEQKKLLVLYVFMKIKTKLICILIYKNIYIYIINKFRNFRNLFKNIDR